MATSATYPPKSAPALGYLKASLNDIAIYVEDKSAPNMWVKLLKKYLPDGVRLNSVTSMGSRENVLAACKADQVSDGRKKLYIIDADLDLIKGTPKPKLKHLYRLRSYCVENYLLNEVPLLALATTFDSSLDTDAAQAKLDYSTWLNANCDLMRRLFVCYAVTNALAEQHPTVGHSVHRLLDRPSHADCFCSQKTNSRIFSLFRSVRKSVDSSELRRCYEKFSNTARRYQVHEIVSGKDYILPLVHLRMKKLFKMSVSIKVFKVMLADHANTRIDPFLSRRLANICG